MSGLPTLRPGAAGAEVTLLQRILSAAALYHLTGPAADEPGVFSPDTALAVHLWQHDRGLTPDGIVGPATWASFETELPLAETAGGNHQLTPHFALREFACYHCQKVKLRYLPELADRLEALRAHFGGRSVTITSPYRCPEHNARIPGAVPNSQHVQGRAVDVRVYGVSPANVATYAEGAGWSGVGRYPGFTHLDLRDVPVRFRGGRRTPDL